MRQIWYFSLFLFWVPLGAQLPQTQIYVLDMKYNEQKVILDDLKYLTAFNPNGYNNQPHFIDNDVLLITSDWQSEATDIIKLDLSNDELSRVTRTSAGEYSPTLQPEASRFSVVKQSFDEDQSAVQELWSLPLDQSQYSEVLINDPFIIGYHAWISPEKVALFLVDEPSRLILYDLMDRSSRAIAENIGRCLKTDNKGFLYYSQAVDSKKQIKRYNPNTERSEVVATQLPDQEDFEVLSNGILISAEGASLHMLRPLIDNDWKEILDLSTTGIGDISRISSSNKRLAIVTRAE